MIKFSKYPILSAVLGIAAFGQTATTSTTLSVAITDRALQQVTLASATNVSANGYLFVDGEVMTVNGSYSTGTTIPVKRGGPGTRSVLHPSGATVYVFAPGDQARTGLINYDLYGACVRTDHTILPRINSISGRIFDCFGSYWYSTDSTALARYTLSIAPGAQPSAASPAVGTPVLITGQAGGAQSATTSGGAAGASITETGGVGGVGGTSSGTGGAGGALIFAGGVGGGTVTGGAGGAVSYTGGAGGAGSGAGGTGGALTLGSGAAGSGGTGTSGAVAVKFGASNVLATAAATGNTTLSSVGSTSTITLAPGASGSTTTALPIASTLATGTAPFTIASTTPVANLTSQVLAYNAAGTQQTSSHAVFGTCTLGTSCVITLTGAAAFTGTTTYYCSATDQTAAAATKVVNTAGGTVTITGTATDVIGYVCIGN